MKMIEEIQKNLGFDFPKNTKFEQVKNGLSVSCVGGNITVSYARKCELARAALLIKSNGTDGDWKAVETSSFDDVCLMIDCSRNAVRSVETVKKLIRNIAMMGYSSLMLYTEDTYEVNNEPLFGYLRGRYTKDELKELDKFAISLGVDLIPCVQTLAHLNQLKRYWLSHYKCFDCGDILLVGNERTHELIENIFSTLAECFTTRRAHIGMDEAWLLGRGRYQDENGAQSQFDVFAKHLQHVCSIAEKYGFTPIIWSDAFMREVYSNPDCKDKDGNRFVPEKVVKSVPKNLELCHWDYHYVRAEDFEEKLRLHTQLNNPVWFAGGTVEDNRGFLPHLNYSIKTATAAIEAAKKHGVKRLVETVWSDNGGECSVFSIMPAVMHYAYEARGLARQQLKKDFKALFNYDFDSFIKIEYAQTFAGKYTSDLGNPAKYGLYSDIFSGYLDAVINPEDKRYFTEAKNAVKNLRKGEYGYLFETAYRLSEVLELKYDMGVRLREAYQKGDKAELENISKDIKTLVTKLKKFISVCRIQWLKENKPHGLEIQEIRLGGLQERLKGCLERLEAYIGGKIDAIEELDEKLEKNAVIRMCDGNRPDIFSHIAIASVNSFDGFTDIDV